MSALSTLLPMYTPWYRGMAGLHSNPGRPLEHINLVIIEHRDSARSCVLDVKIKLKTDQVLAPKGCTPPPARLLLAATEILRESQAPQAGECPSYFIVAAHFSSYFIVAAHSLS